MVSWGLKKSGNRLSLSTWALAEVMQILDRRQQREREAPDVKRGCREVIIWRSVSQVHFVVERVA